MKEVVVLHWRPRAPHRAWRICVTDEAGRSSIPAELKISADKREEIVKPCRKYLRRPPVGYGSERASKSSGRRRSSGKSKSPRSNDLGRRHKESVCVAAEVFRDAFPSAQGRAWHSSSGMDERATAQAQAGRVRIMQHRRHWSTFGHVDAPVAPTSASLDGTFTIGLEQGIRERANISPRDIGHAQSRLPSPYQPLPRCCGGPA